MALNSGWAISSLNHPQPIMNTFPIGDVQLKLNSSDNYFLQKQSKKAWVFLPSIMIRSMIGILLQLLLLI